MAVEAVHHGVIHDRSCVLHQILGFSHIDEASGHDVRAGQQLIAVFLQRQHDDDDTVLSQVLSVTQHDIADVADTQSVYQDSAC